MVATQSSQANQVHDLIWLNLPEFGVLCLVSETIDL